MPSRTNFLPRILVVALVGSVPILSACGARVVQLGTNGDTSDKLKTVTTSAAQQGTTSIGACPAGFAHPNICCEATANQDPTCGAWENDPFHACDPGWSTYPNALSCCSLADPKDCVDTPSDAGLATAPPPPYGCGFACPPGWYQPADGITPGGTTVSCCQTLADGTTECTGSASVTPISTPACGGPTPPADAGTTTDDDGGVFVGAQDASVADAGVGTIDASVPPDSGTTLPACDAGIVDPYPPAYDGGGASLCEPCPAGWTADALDPLLCCQQSAALGVRECFSRATGGTGTTGNDDGGVWDGGVSVSDAEVPVPDASIAPPPPEDAGTTTPDPGSFCTATLSDSCTCQNDTGGHTYVLDCSLTGTSATATCFCEKDGTTTSQFTTTNPECANLTYASGDYLNRCGFPQP